MKLYFLLSLNSHEHGAEQGFTVPDTKATLPSVMHLASPWDVVMNAGVLQAATKNRPATQFGCLLQAWEKEASLTHPRDINTCENVVRRVGV